VSKFISNFMFYRRISCLVFIFAILPWNKIFADEYFTIENYQIFISATEANVYHVTEAIDVAFSEPRHGIYRRIPAQFRKNPVVISNIEVERHPFSVEKKRKEYFIRIGSPADFVSGAQRYVIHYTFDLGDDRNRKMDEFYFNLIGPEWETHIKKAEFSVQMPFPFDRVKVNCTSGYSGSTDNGNVSWQVQGTKIFGEIREPLLPNQTLTIALPLPEAYWQNPQKHFDLIGFILFLLGYPFYSLIVMSLALFWFLKGRNRSLIPTVEFYPPDGMTPADIGYIIDGEVDDLDVSSLIIYWAEQGALEIIIEKDDLTLRKTGELSKTAHTYEKYLFKNLFKGREIVAISSLANTFFPVTEHTRYLILKSFGAAKDTGSQPDLDLIRETVRSKMGDSVNLAGLNLEDSNTSDDGKDNLPNRENEKRSEVYQAPSGWRMFLLGFVSSLPVLMLIIISFSSIPPNSIQGLHIKPVNLGLFMISPFILLSLFIISYSLAIPGRMRQKGVRTLTIILILVLIIFAFVFHFTAVRYGDGEISLYFASALASLAAMFFMFRMKLKRTKYGNAIFEKILGFKNFIEKAEMDKLKLLFEEDPSYFYNVLPYAQALGLSRQWASHFENLSLQPPNWYHDSSRRFEVDRFADRLNNDFARMSSAMSSTPPSKSSSSSSVSSSSGGSAGGGAGGGGGGSW
jgi:uncharacterized membrane protein YgcG